MMRAIHCSILLTMKAVMMKSNARLGPKRTVQPTSNQDTLGSRGEARIIFMQS